MVLWSYSSSALYACHVTGMSAAMYITASHMSKAQYDEQLHTHVSKGTSGRR